MIFHLSTLLSIMIGNRYKYKSSVCRVLDENTDQFGRVYVYWEGEYFANWVDVKSSAYKRVEEKPQDAVTSRGGPGWEMKVD